MEVRGILPLLRWVCVALFVVNASAQTPQINEGGVVSGASFAAAPAPVAAGSIISIFGTDLATSSAGAADLPLPTNINGTQVLVNDIAAPLFFVSPNQINAQLPWEFIDVGMVNVQVVVDGVESNIVSIAIAAQGPGVFATNQAGSGQGAILISGAGGALAAPMGVSPGARSVMRGEELIEIFCTGLGAVANQPASGAPAPEDPLSETALLPTVTIGGVPAPVSFSGLAPGFVGLYQVNAQVPKDGPIGEAVPVVLNMGGVDSNTVTIAVHPAPGEVVITAISPPTIDVDSGDTTLVIEGFGFTPESVVQAGDVELDTTFVSSTRLQVFIPASLLAQTGTITLTVTTPGQVGPISVSVNLEVLITVKVTPAATELITGQTQQFTATVSGTENTAVTWSVEGTGSEPGMISSDGLYMTPQVVPEPPAIEVRATSAADPQRFGAATVAINSPKEDWSKYRRDLANTGRSAETGISSHNISRFSRKWRFDTGNKISASPAVATVEGVRMVYVGNWAGVFSAVDADTGTLIWSFTVDMVGTMCSSGTRCRIGSSAVVENGIVYFGAENAFVYALDAATGALVWKTQLGDPDQGYEIWSSPAVQNGSVYVGVASHNSEPCVVGSVQALDAGTGVRVWNFDTIDQSTCPSGFCVGAGVWSSPAIDTRFNTLYVGTGNSGKGCVPSTANATKYPDGILALDLATGQLKTFFQTFPNDPNDKGDVGASPALHETLTINECTGLNSTSYWMTVPSKDSVVHTAPRGLAGLLADPVGIPLNSGRTIASPAVLPFRQSRPCGTQDLQIVEGGNDIFVPSFDGVLFSIRQLSDGNTSIRWSLLVKTCPPENPCPLYSAPASITDLVIFGGGEGNIHAATSEGELVWSAGTLGLVASGPAISHSTIYYGSFDGFLYASSRDGQ